jgi:TonB family protein
VRQAVPWPINYTDVQRAAATAYPDALKLTHVPVVFLWFEVRADGSTGEVQLWKSSGSRAADGAALRTGSQMRWRPARCGTQPVTVRYGHPLAVRRPA